MTPNFDAIPLERAVCAWCSRCVASVCFRIEGEVHPAATLVTGWGRTTLGRGKHRASGQRDAIHDRSVFGAQLTFDRMKALQDHSTANVSFAIRFRAMILGVTDSESQL